MGLEENKVQKKVMDYFNKPYSMIYKSQACADYPYIKNSKAFRINSKGIKGRKSTLPEGFPDVLAVLTIKGVAIPFFIEIKAPGRKCNNEQQLQFIKTMDSMGALSVWVNSLEMMKEYIRSQAENILAKFAE